MIKNYKSKSKTYASIIVGLCLMTAVGSSADAQVVYTDGADVTLNGDDIIQIDFTNNYATDVELQLGDGNGTPYLVNGSWVADARRDLESYGSGNGRIATSSTAPNYADRLDLGAIINVNNTYDDDGQTKIYDVANSNLTYQTYAGMVERNTPASPWVENTADKYLGVKFLIGHNTHYGWILMSVNSQYTATIKSFAYNTTPGEAITAGQTVTSIFNSKAEALNVNLFEETLTLGKMTRGGNVSVMNATGNEVFSSKVNAGDNEYKVAGLTPGLYIVNVNLEEKVITKKVMVN